MARVKPLAREDVLAYGPSLRAAPLRAFRRDRSGNYRPRVAMWRLLRESRDGWLALDPESITRFKTVGRCLHCGETFLRGYRVSARVCSNRCARERERQRAREWAKANYQPRERTLHRTKCEQCGETFKAVRADARFCSVRCRVAAHRAA